MVFWLFAWATIRPVEAREVVGQQRTSAKRTLRTAAACLPSTSSSELDVNNVRALLHNGGDMWWDLVSNPRYEVPKVDDPAKAKHALFAGALWVGGTDQSGQLRIAAQTYRQSGNDYFPGPLRIDNTASTDDNVCKDFDRHFKVNRTEINQFLSAFPNVDAAAFPGIFNWPAFASLVSNNIDAGYSNAPLAPFVDVNNDGKYVPTDGDYPNINGDQAIWWVINDKGDIHTETRGEQIGIEIQVTAFAFSTSNAVNNMTFYRQKLINRSTFNLQNTFVGQWVDADLGFAFDDYVGCDTIRGLGYCYNGDNDDNQPQGYGINPPAVGVDFFQGPLADNSQERISNGKDENYNGVIDDPAERYLSMSKFIYYDNDVSVRGNPTQASHFYGYLTGFWKNGSPIVDDRTGNGNGFPEQGEVNKGTNYMFPDYPGPGCAARVLYDTTQVWDEATAGNNPFDRRFIQSAGPFTLKSGSSNEIIIGVVWARDENNSLDSDQFGSVCALLEADDIAQALFDSNFDLLDGPDAPDLAITSYDQALTLTWSYTNPASNNLLEDYSEYDPVLRTRTELTDDQKRFNFEGYIVYQLLDGTVSASQLSDPTKARIVAQCDIKNGISTIVNRVEQTIAGVSEPVIVDRVMVDGADRGLIHSIRIEKDLFPEGSNDRLINYRTYYYTIVAYAYNDITTDGRKFILGNGNFKSYAAIPHKISFQNLGTQVNSVYGLGPQVQQLQGRGSGGYFTRLTPETEARLLQPPFVDVQPFYAPNAAPVDIKVVNPKLVKPGTYQLELVRNQYLDSLPVSKNYGAGAIDSVFADWILYDVSGGQKQLVYSSRYRKTNALVDGPEGQDIPIEVFSAQPWNGVEKMIRRREPSGDTTDFGISIAVRGVGPSGDTLADNLGFVGARISYADNTKAWYSGLPDQNNFPDLNWIRTGPAWIQKETPPGQAPDPTDPETENKGSMTRALPSSGAKWFERAARLYDPKNEFGNILNGTWAPHWMTAHFNTSKDLLGLSYRTAIRGRGTQEELIDADQVDPRLVLGLDELPNVDIIMTPDKSKWSRCVVVETSPTKAQGSQAHILTAKWRKSLSLEETSTRRTAQPPAPGSTDYGMSWFPGYAVNTETGERLNIFFGEATWYKLLNGDDMLFNPVFNFSNLKGAGGRHFIYVSNTRYDECAALAQKLRVPIDAPSIPVTSAHPFRFQVGSDTVNASEAYYQVAWSSIGFPASQTLSFETPDKIPTEVRIQLRVNRPFSNASGSGVVPVYQFNLDSLAAQTNQSSIAKGSLDSLVNIVPNPYYGRSGTGLGRYEKTQLDSRVKITNLPKSCTIKIFTLPGTLIRTFRKESDAPSIDWDLKNDQGVPIAGGIYLIHIDAQEFGTKVLKFFAIMPELDLNAY